MNYRFIRLIFCGVIVSICCGAKSTPKDSISKNELSTSDLIKIIKAAKDETENPTKKTTKTMLTSPSPSLSQEKKQLVSSYPGTKAPHYEQKSSRPYYEEISSNYFTNGYSTPVKFYHPYDDQHDEAKSYYFNKSLTIAWKKTDYPNYRISIFSSKLSNGESLIVWYYLTINSIVFEIIKYNMSSSFEILRLGTLRFDYLFFTFNNYGALGIYLDCPSLTNQKIQYDFYVFNLMQDVQIFNGAILYDKMESAMRDNYCKIPTSVQPSMVLHLETSLDEQSSVLLFSFSNNGMEYSLIYFNGYFKLLAGNGMAITITNEPVYVLAPNGIYLLFNLNNVEIYTTCPSKREPALQWHTKFFNRKTQIETSLKFKSSSVLLPSLLEKFCFTKFLEEFAPRSSYVPSKLVSMYLDNINTVSPFTNLFLPMDYQVDKLLQFRTTPGFSLNFLVRTETRLLIASRAFAKRGFFDRSIREYVSGFSDGGENFWIGLDTLHKATQKFSYTLRVEVFFGGKFIAEEYGLFKVGSGENNFRLSIGNLKSGVNAFFEYHDYADFSTFDFGNQRFQAIKYSAGFWHRPTEPRNTSIDNFYCFGCEDDMDSFGTSFIQTISYFTVKSYVTKMYLIL
ncbi:tenascin isoform X1 [Brachionus plicatilis]|uniref:Tenascin isoform X1 n=1 Tax=Brachionus plicatilis TaxID=10195 RepID=A0A3M7P9D2_BRAPC|nr:tenascin isoform X1 [Brachionus plicatilis]